MRKILVPCDFSDSAIQAFRFAVEVAEQSDGEIILLNIIELPVMHDTALAPTLSFEESFMKDMKESAEKNFEKMKSKFAKGGPRVKTMVEYGPIHLVIQQTAKAKQADLIIMGTKGSSGLKEFMVGSNTEKIVRSSSVPVIAIKKSVTAASIKNIVFPNTLDDNQEELVTKIKSLQTFFDATLHVVYINTPGNFQRDSETKARMKAFAKRFMLKDYTLQVYNDVDHETGLASYLKEVKGDLVVMATHGRRGLSHFFSGSIAEDVVNHIDCPIWTYKAD
ncbi:MAG TPA: universal stress protein [Cyclobacteriaceae bacterium]|nr:universal stress protein [Cyclobacteriaceae bacterium]